MLLATRRKGTKWCCHHLLPLLFPVPLRLPENEANLKNRLAGLMPWRSGGRFATACAAAPAFILK